MDIDLFYCLWAVDFDRKSGGGDSEEVTTGMTNIYVTGKREGVAVYVGGPGLREMKGKGGREVIFVGLLSEG